MDNEQKAYLRRILIENPNDKKLICNLYKLSASVLRRIYWHTERALNEGLYLIRTGQHKSEIIPEIRLWVERMIRPPITLAKIRNEIFEKFRIDFGIHTIRRLLRNELKYTYRKGSSRTQKYATSRIIGVKKLFCTELLKMLLTKELIINVDESSWDRSLKMEYSWFPRSRSYSIINNIFTGKANLILGTMKNDDWIAMIHSETGDSLKFWLFLKVLEKVWLIWRREISLNLTILVDNAIIHTSKLTKSICEGMNILLRLTPPYWPEVAPVEQIFCALKSKLVSSECKGANNFGKIRGLTHIANWLGELSSETWMGAWTNVCQEMKRTIVSTDMKNSEEDQD